MDDEFTTVQEDLKVKMRRDSENEWWVFHGQSADDLYQQGEDFTQRR
jgi:hypothetical protein